MPRCASRMGMQGLGAHLDEQCGTVLDMLSKQLHTEVFCLNQEGVTPIRALRAHARFQPFGTVHALAFGLRQQLLDGESLAHRVTQGQITREVHCVHACQERRDALAIRCHRSISLSCSPTTHVSVEGRETQSALLPARRRPAVGRANEQERLGRVAPPSALAGRPRCLAPAIPPRRSGRKAPCGLSSRPSTSCGAPLRWSALRASLDAGARCGARDIPDLGGTGRAVRAAWTRRSQEHVSSPWIAWLYEILDSLLLRAPCTRFLLQLGTHR